MRGLHGTGLAVALGLGLGQLAWAQEGAGGPKEVTQPAVEKPAAKPVDVEKLLDSTRLKAEFLETPLKDVCSYLSEILNIDILFDHQGLTSLAVTEDSPVTLTISKSEVSARTILELALRQVDPQLTAMPKDGLLLITSGENSFVTVSYPLGELLSVDAKGRVDIIDATALIDLIKSKVASTSWLENGSPGSMDIFRAALVVKNSPQAHREIRDMLDLLRPEPKPVVEVKPLVPAHSRRLDRPEPKEPNPEDSAIGDVKKNEATIKLIFKVLDVNADGKLQKDELKNTKIDLAIADKDKDGEISVEEFVEYATNR